MLGWPKRPPKPKDHGESASSPLAEAALKSLDIKPKLGRWDQAVDKLIEQTRCGDLKWVKTTVMTNDERPGLMYTTDVLDKSIAVYIYHYKNWLTGTDFEWKMSATVRFLDGHVCTSRWQCMTSRPFWLFHAVEEQLVGTQTFLEDYLK